MTPLERAAINAADAVIFRKIESALTATLRTVTAPSILPAIKGVAISTAGNVVSMLTDQIKYARLMAEELEASVEILQR